MKFKQLVSLFLISIFFVAIANAGVVMVTEVKSGGKTSINRAYVENNKLRADAKSGKMDSIMIFRADKKLMWAIDNKKKAYHEMTEADFKKMNTQMNDAMKKMQAEMKKMPPAQRKMMEKMMKGQMVKPKKPSKLVYKKVASNQKVGKWKCDKYAVLQDNKRIATVWTTDWRAFRLGPNDFKVFDSFSKMMSQNMPAGYSVNYKAFSKKSGLNGVPVKRVGQNSSWTMKEMKKERINGSLFDLPSGLKKMKKQ
ncbi:MAG: hypothetical protein HQ564_02305 [Candidatus Saganbacteria bacterium]|nr:hypothetical protein [Candidatus Saganbacteria bacterium]